MATHSPAPWTVEYAANGAAVGVRDSSGPNTPGAIGSVIRRNGFGCPAGDEGRANARLIAAAPDLLAAAKEAWWALSGESYDPERWDKALDMVIRAIAKAESGG